MLNQSKTLLPLRMDIISAVRSLQRGKEKAQRINMLLILLERKKKINWVSNLQQRFIFKISNTEFTVFKCTHPGHVLLRQPKERFC